MPESGEIELRVAEALQQDVGKGIVRIDKELLQRYSEGLTIFMANSKSQFRSTKQIRRFQCSKSMPYGRSIVLNFCYWGLDIVFGFRY